MSKFITARFNGNIETHSIEGWAKILGIHPKTINSRLHRGFTGDQIVNIAVGETKSSYEKKLKAEIDKYYQQFCFNQLGTNHEIQQ